MNLFHVYLNELTYWNKKINLTGLSSGERIVNELFLDSIIPAPFILHQNNMLDIGSGAGFPAIPLKIIHPRLKIRLVESNSKKASFLKHIIRVLELKDIRVYKRRAETLAQTLFNKGFSLVTARAVAPLEQTIQLCSPFLSQNGYLICFLGNEAEKILEKNKVFLEKNYFSIYKKISYTLPGRTIKRHAIILKKNNN